jgi:hypothetical protein
MSKILRKDLPNKREEGKESQIEMGKTEDHNVPQTQIMSLIMRPNQHFTEK